MEESKPMKVEMTDDGLLLKDENEDERRFLEGMMSLLDGNTKMEGWKPRRCGCQETEQSDENRKLRGL